MLKPHGYATWTGGGNKETVEADTITCGHCNSIVVVNRKDFNTGFCRMCMDHICLNCEKKGSCTPFEKKMEQMEAKDRFNRNLRELGI